MSENETAVAVSHVDMAAELVSAYVSNNRVPPSELPELIASVHAAISGLGQPISNEPAVERPTPTQIRKSITHDGLISFIDGKAYKTLRRHLTTNGMTFEEYRSRFGLPQDYPSVAASYSAQRAELARSFGLGQQRRKTAQAAPEPIEGVEVKPKRRGRPRKAENHDA